MWRTKKNHGRKTQPGGGKSGGRGIERWWGHVAQTQPSGRKTGAASALLCLDLLSKRPAI
jgi:hypothetical protein